MKSSSAINPAIAENAKLLIIKTCTPIKIVGVSLDGGVLLSFNCFQLLQTLWVTFQVRIT